jgi:hypothetical protein
MVALGKKKLDLDFLGRFSLEVPNICAMTAEPINDNEGRMEMTKLIDAFRDHAKASKIECYVMQSECFLEQTWWLHKWKKLVS